MKPFAIIMLEDLKTRTFDHEDEWREAIRALRARNKAHIVLKWSSAGFYIQPEIHA